MNGNRDCIEIGEGQSSSNFTMVEFIFAISMIICGFLYSDLIFFSDMGLGVLVFVLALFTSTLYYFNKNQIKQSRESLLWIGIVAIGSVQFMLFDDYRIKEVNLLFISICFIYWVSISNKNCIESKLSIYTIWDLINNTFVIPFSNFAKGSYGLKYGLSRNKHSKNIQYILVGIAIVLPLMIFVINQLISADAAFEATIVNFENLISFETLLDYVIQFALGIPVASYLFGLIYGNVKKCNVSSMDKKDLIKFSEEISFFPRLTIYTVLTVLNIIYIIFFISQMAYFLSAFDNVLPGGFTYAEYARRGFFELCKVSFVNLMLITLAHIFIKKDGKTKFTKVLRVETAFLSLMTMGLIVTALSKMCMYIQSYGLTQLRIYTSWCMILMLVFFTVIFTRQIIEFNAARIIIASGVIGVIILSYGNIDGNIAKYNIKNYENGRLEKIDYNMLLSLSDGAVPYIYEHYKKIENEEVRYMLYNKIGYNSIPEESTSIAENIKEFNMQSYRANQIRNEIRKDGSSFKIDTYEMGE
ncbi:MAG: DUF4153 domain-containing protein [Aminipila sp.]